MVIRYARQEDTVLFSKKWKYSASNTTLAQRIQELNHSFMLDRRVCSAVVDVPEDEGTGVSVDWLDGEVVSGYVPPFSDDDATPRHNTTLITPYLCVIEISPISQLETKERDSLEAGNALLRW